MRPRDIWRLAAFLAAGLLLGVITGTTPWMLFAASVLYIAWIHRKLYELLVWLRNRKENEPPEHPGTFEELSLEIDYLRERHKKRKKKLANYLKQFQKATRALPDATVVLDIENQVRWANGAARRDLGVCWPEDVGQRLTNIVRVPVLRDFLDHDTASSNATIEIEAPMDDSRYLSVLTAPYGTNQRILVARDVTQLHRVNEIRSDFVANVSHELRTPITVFQGYLETLRDQTEDCPPTWVPALEHMTAHARRMRSLVDELLMLSSLESEPRVSDPQIVDVPALIGEIHERARELGGDAGQLFTLEIDGSLCVLGDREELYSAFSNLVFNAVQYSGERSVIRIRWHGDSQGAQFEVEDNGIGVAVEHIPRLTERFYRVDASRARDEQASGTGLGLAIAKHALTRHGAALSIESELGQGSCFRASFPASEVHVREAPAARDAG